MSGLKDRIILTIVNLLFPPAAVYALCGIGTRSRPELRLLRLGHNPLSYPWLLHYLHLFPPKEKGTKNYLRENHVTADMG